MDGGLSNDALGARAVRRRGSADSDSTLTSLETVRTLPGGLSKYVSNKEAAISWTTHLVPGDMVLECVTSPGACVCGSARHIGVSPTPGAARGAGCACYGCV